MPSLTGHALAALIVLGATGAPAQEPRREPAVSGKVHSSSGTPIAGVDVRIAHDGAHTRTDSRGAFALGKAPDGAHTLHFTAGGYLPAMTVVNIPDQASNLDVVMVPVPPSLAHRRHGSRKLLGGLITDTRGRPIAGATVDVYSPVQTVTTSADGWFDVGGLRAGTVIVRVRKAGYEPIVASLRLDDWRGVVLHMAPIPSTPDEDRANVLAGFGPQDEFVWREFDRRLTRRSVRGVIVSREELAPLGSMLLGMALRFTESGAIPALDISSVADQVCVIIDGRRALGPTQLDSFHADEVDFLELYPPGADQSGSLERLSRGMECLPVRLPDTSTIAPYYVVAWLVPR